ncbi:MAG: hypothetical protein ABL879_02540 [Devosia sp.]
MSGLFDELKRLILLEKRPGEDDDESSGLRRDERQASILADKYPPEGDEVDARTSEFSLARHITQPWY